MLRIEDFTNKEYVINIFRNNNIVSDKDILITLESYKFLSHDYIVKIISNINDNISSYHTLKECGDFKDIAIKYNVVILSTSDVTCDIVVDYLSDIHLDSLLLSLVKYKCNVIYVTPYEFLLLREKMYDIKLNVDFDYDILLKRFVIDALEKKATDMHFVIEHFSMNPLYKFYYRIGNKYEEQKLFDLNQTLNKELIHKIVHLNSPTNVNDLGTIAGVTTSVMDVFGDGTTSLRIVGNKCVGGFMYTFRIQNLKSTSLRIEDLGFSKEQQEVIDRDSKRQFGITFITGAMRSGKNTTAFAMANNIYDMGVKIVDYSSPTEALMPFCQVNYLDSEQYLRNGMKLLKKHDVNYVFLNEIPSKDVAFSVQDLVNSSIHVITTLHVNRVWHMPYKLYEYYGENYKNIISQINCIVNQKMFGKCCRNCQDNVVSSYFKDSRIRNFLDKYEVSTLKINRGCDNCIDGEVKGTNAPICEILEFNDDIRHSLLKCEFPYQMEEVIRNYMIENKLSMEFTIADKLRKGEIYISSLDSIL